MTDSKKMWAKPELIVLVRNNPAEAVLGACKTMAGMGPDTYFQNCRNKAATEDVNKPGSGCEGACQAAAHS